MCKHAHPQLVDRPIENESTEWQNIARISAKCRVFAPVEHALQKVQKVHEHETICSEIRIKLDFQRAAMFDIFARLYNICHPSTAQTIFHIIQIGQHFLRIFLRIP